MPISIPLANRREHGARLLRLIALLGLLALAACAQLVPAPPTQPVAGTPQNAWARVLQRFVDEHGRVDFNGLARDRADLEHYVGWIYAVGPENRPDLLPTPQDVLAYHINAYNALAMYSILDAGLPPTLAGLRKVSFFYLHEVSVGGKNISLYDYENKVIRPLGEERVHFALNCMSVSCPRLPRTPFRAETLEQDLELEARRFFNDPRNVEVDPLERSVRFSEILDFYTQDFLAKAPSLIAYANRYRTLPIPEHYRISFIPYDWTVNFQKP